MPSTTSKARLPDGVDGVVVTLVHQRHHVPAVLGLKSGFLELRRHCRSGSQRLETAVVPAPAEFVPAAADPDVADVPGYAVGAAEQFAVADNSGANAGGDLQEHQIRDVGPGGLPLPH